MIYVINLLTYLNKLIYDNLDFESINEGQETQVLEKIRKYIVYYRQILTYLSMLIDELHSSIQFKDSLIK